MSVIHLRIRFLVITTALHLGAAWVFGQALEDEFKRASPKDLAAQAKSIGDAQRGAVVFFQRQMSCGKCHTVGGAAGNGLGPDLATLGKEFSDEALVDATLSPS